MKRQSWNVVLFWCLLLWVFVVVVGFGGVCWVLFGFFCCCLFGYFVVVVIRKPHKCLSNQEIAAYEVVYTCKVLYRTAFLLSLKQQIHKPCFMLGKHQTEKAKGSGFSNELACYFCIYNRNCTKSVWPIFQIPLLAVKVYTRLWRNCDRNSSPFAWLQMKTQSAIILPNSTEQLTCHKTVLLFIFQFLYKFLYM